MQTVGGFLAHTVSSLLVLYSAYYILSSYDQLSASKLSLSEVIRNMGLFSTPLSSLELDVERQHDFMEGFNRIQREEKHLETLMVHAELKRLNGRLKDYELLLRNVEEKASESNRNLQDIMDGFPLEKQATVSLTINIKNVFHHLLLCLLHLGYILGYGGHNIRLASIAAQGIVGVCAVLFVQWADRLWLMYFVYMVVQMFLAIQGLRGSRIKILCSKISLTSEVVCKREALLLGKYRVQLFHHACLYGLKNVMRSILRAGFEDIEDIYNSVNSLGLTGLHLISLGGHGDIFTQWMAHKSLCALDVNALTPTGESPLFLAIQREHPSLAKRLLKRSTISLKDYALAFRSEQYELFNILYSWKKPSSLLKASTDEKSRFTYLDAYVKRFNANLSSSRRGTRSNLEFYVAKINEALSQENGNALQSSSSSSLAELFECLVCFEEMRERIYACVYDHWLCASCFESVDSCPACRLSFAIRRNYYRAINAQKIAQIVFKDASP